MNRIASPVLLFAGMTLAVLLVACETTSTSTVVPTSDPTVAATPTHTPGPTSTSTPMVPTPTSAAPTSTPTPISTPTPTASPTPSPMPATIPTATPTTVPLESGQFPPFPDAFSGTVTVDNQPAPDGVSIYAQVGYWLSESVTTSGGRYQALVLSPVDWSLDEGTITFYVEGVQAEQTAVFDRHILGMQTLDLTVVSPTTQ